MLGRIAVFVSGNGTNLQALIDARGKTLKSGEITLVISNRNDTYALTRARNAGIETAVFEENFERNALELLHRQNIDLIVLAGFMKILSNEFVSVYRERIINVHPSLIPSFCGESFYGIHVHEAAINYGVKVSGATVHFVNEVTDGGKIIMQKSVEVEENDTPQTLGQRIMEQAEWVILPQATEKVIKEILCLKETTIPAGE